MFALLAQSMDDGFVVVAVVNINRQNGCLYMSASLACKASHVIQIVILMQHQQMQWSQPHGALSTDSLNLHNLLHSMKPLACSAPLWMLVYVPFKCFVVNGLVTVG